MKWHVWMKVEREPDTLRHIHNVVQHRRNPLRRRIIAKQSPFNPATGSDGVPLEVAKFESVAIVVMSVPIPRLAAVEQPVANGMKVQMTTPLSPVSIRTETQPG
jgi:hypothetical protein